jgi:hypothetical protein
MLENLLQYHGFNTALSGLFIVFSGLVLIALVIHSFNFLFKTDRSINKEDTDESKDALIKKPVLSGVEIPPDHLIAIAAAVELYRRLHYDRLDSQVTFERGELNPGWKVGYKFGQRYHTLRKT